MALSQISIGSLKSANSVVNKNTAKSLHKNNLLAKEKGLYHLRQVDIGLYTSILLHLGFENSNKFAIIKWKVSLITSFR